jgi:acyl-CoA synthetase (AMP-forming)/AMP-acid ligase II
MALMLRPTFWPATAAAYRRDGHWGTVPLGERFAGTCARQGYAEALIDGDRRLSFAEWDRLSARAALGLLALGVAPGDVVAYQLPNWWEAAVIFLAAARIGAVVNPVLPIFRARELRFVLAQSGAAVLVIPGAYRGCDYRQLVDGLRADLPHLREVLVARADPPPSMRALEAFLATPWERAPQTADRVVTAVDADALLMLMYTSGTSAEPKGVLHTHNTLLAEVQSLARIHGLSPRDRTLMPSPLTHISGVIHAILAPALLGTSAVLMERWDAAPGLELIARERVTYMVGAPTFLHDLVEHPDRSRHDTSSLRLFSCGGASVSADLIRRARAALGCVAKRVYGSTEFPTITTTDATDAAGMGIESEGRPIAPAEVRIVDNAGRAVSTGGEGEIQARGPECCVGYTEPSLNEDAFTADGWFRTGDLGTLDVGGYLRVTGRLKDIVIRKGEKFSVRELEEHIARHPAVSDAAVLALPDPRSGERACAVVVLHAGAALTLDELMRFLRAEGLAVQKLPEQLEVVDALPRTDSGKVHRAALKARFA